MKLTKTTIIAIVAASGLLAFSPALRAQDQKKDAKPADAKPADVKSDKGGKRGGMSVDARLAQYTERLKLTDEQKPKVKVALEDQSKKMQEVTPEDRQTKMPAIREEFSKKMKEILTAEQFKEFEAMPQRGGRAGGQGKKGGDAGAPPAPEKKAEPAKK